MESTKLYILYLSFCNFFLVSLNEQIYSYDADDREICLTEFDSRHINNRIVGGKNADKDFPFATGIIMQRLGNLPLSVEKSFCGGTMITPRHILTAGHCVYGFERSLKKMRVNVGDYDLTDDSEVVNYIREVHRVYLHPKYDDDTLDNDVAVIELREAVPFENGMRAAILPPAGVQLSIGTMCTVIGWGRTAYDGLCSNVLQQVNVPITSRRECQKHLESRITRNMICAGGREGEDACMGDSGSGLFVRIDNNYVTCGTVSFGRECALKDVSGVYCDVSKYVDWICEKTRSASCKPRIFPKHKYVK